MIALSAWVIVGAFLMGNWLIGSRRRAGWLVAIGTGIGACIYDGVTAQWGFLVGAVVGIIIAARNYDRWSHDSRLS